MPERPRTSGSSRAGDARKSGKVPPPPPRRSQRPSDVTVPPPAADKLPRDRVEISASGDAVILRVVGLGNAARSVAVADVGESLIQRGFDRIVVDLARCRGLDSTFMGTLVALATTIEEAREARGSSASGSSDVASASAARSSDAMNPPGAPAPREARPISDGDIPRANCEPSAFALPPAGVPLVLANAPEHVVTQMNTLGLLGVDALKLLDEPVAFPECAMKMLPDKPDSQEKRLKVIRDAHEKLIELDERNEERFGPFLRAMLAEMDQQHDTDSQ